MADLPVSGGYVGYGGRKRKGRRKLLDCLSRVQRLLEEPAH